MSALEDVRRFYAEEIRAVADLHSEALVAAFAQVPRERFLGPGPWRIVSPEAVITGAARYRTTPDDDPRHVYHNVLVALDPERNLNNGQPSGIALWLDALDPRPGERFVHVGCGVGYYTAIAAEVVGPGGRVLALEVDAGLAARARANLAGYGWVEVVAADGAAYDPGPADALFVNAGATQLQAVWLDALCPGGRLMVPLTFAADPAASNPGNGLMLKVTRGDGAVWPARFVSPVGIFPCQGARTPEGNQRFREALVKGTWTTVRSLRRDPHEKTDACWLHGDGFCLSTAAAA
jgi:protein-L-isoaspartate(D-aspartate) O-methyltransferase